MHLSSFFFIHLLPSLGFLLALFLLVHIIRFGRSSGSTFAWLLVIILVPYIGVPLYIILGDRKIKKVTDAKTHLVKGRERSAAEKQTHAFFFEDTGAELFDTADGNLMELLSDGEDTFRALIKHLSEAQKCIYVATYILGKDESGDELLRVLTEKAADGLEVCLLLDAIGTLRRSRKALRDFKAAGGKLSFFMPVLRLPFRRSRANLRNHRKIVIIDNSLAMVGGMNLATEYMGYEEDDARWCDLSMMIQGPSIEDLYEVFRSDWQFASGKSLTTPYEEIQPFSGDRICAAQVMPSGPDVDGDFLHEAIVTSFFRAQKRIWITTPYFVPDQIILRGLCMAAHRGVDVRVLVPAKSNHLLADIVRRGFLNDIKKAGGKVLYYTPRMMHAKLILVDDGIGITGSANMDMRSLFLNYEIALFIYTEAAVVELEGWMQGLFKDCEEKDHESTVTGEFFEGMARLLAPLL